MNLDRTFFITTVTWKRTPLFRSQPKAELMMDVLLRYREQMRYVLHEFVIMPDHLHLQLTPRADISLERALQLIKGGFSYRLGKAKTGLIWQESFTNHPIRDQQHSHESGPRAPGGEAGDVSVFVGERQVRKNVRKKNNERRKPCDLRQPSLEARLPNPLTPTTLKMFRGIAD